MTDHAPFTTNLSSVAPGAISVRGFDLATIIRHASFADGIFLLLAGCAPTPAERHVFEAILLTPLDHGFVNTMSNTARFAMSASQFLPAAVAAGVCAGGTVTETMTAICGVVREVIAAEHENPAGGVQQAARLVVADRLTGGGRIPGLGHPMHKHADPRASALVDVAEAAGVGQRERAAYEAVREALRERTGRNLVVNVDGMAGALLVAMGFEDAAAAAAMLLATVPSIAAHAIEEASAGRGPRFLPAEATQHALPAAGREWRVPPVAERGR